MPYFLNISVSPFLEKYRDSFIAFLQSKGIANHWAVLLQSVIAIGLMCFLAWLTFRLATFFMRTYIPKLAGKTANKWDDIFLENKVFAKLAYFLPGLVMLFFYDFISANAVRWLIDTLISSYFIVVFLIFCNALLNAINDIYTHIKGQPSSFKIFIQLLKVLIFSLGILAIISIFADKNFMDILTGLGAMLTILLIVYKDMIMGFVSGIQLSANKMVTVGDWVVLPKDGADGTVIDIGLTTVKVQNWDKTITTIPTYKLTSESFTNWKGMEQSEGRRIKRHISIDMESIHFLSPEEIESFKKIRLIKSYIQDKLEQITKVNAQEPEYVNQRKLTNIGTFRKYVENYLRESGYANLDMTFIVRQLQSTEKGVPIEIYMFSKVKEWASYEQIQSDIFDHIFAIIPTFHLRIFQEPSGHNFSKHFN